MTEFTGSQTLTDLEPGTYLFAATLDDHSPVEQAVQLEQDGSETVELTLPQEGQ
jgi:hypothetical protein